MIIGFSTTNKIFSRLIRKLTKSKASHSYIKYRVSNEDLVLQANKHGVEFDQHINFVKHAKIVAEFNIALPNEQAALSYAIEQLDKPYDFLAMAGFPWVLLNKAFGRKVKNPFPNRSAYYCSELILMTLRAGEYPGIDALDRESTSPEDLIEFLSKDNHRII